jgi:hypothetical protein
MHKPESNKTHEFHLCTPMKASEIDYFWAFFLTFYFEARETRMHSEDGFVTHSKAPIKSSWHPKRGNWMPQPAVFQKKNQVASQASSTKTQSGKNSRCLQNKVPATRSLAMNIMGSIGLSAMTVA